MQNTRLNNIKIRKFVVNAHIQGLRLHFFNTLSYIIGSERALSGKILSSALFYCVDVFVSVLITHGTRALNNANAEQYSTRQREQKLLFADFFEDSL